MRFHPMATSRAGTRAIRRGSRGLTIRLAPHSPKQHNLYSAVDHGQPVTLDPGSFAPQQRGGGWGAFAEPFLRMNEPALAAIDVRAEFAAGADGTVVRLHAGGRAGAIPLRSAQTGQISAGFVVKPRFGWAGVGRVLSETGWHAAPEFLDLPLVPGSGREVPPWVLAGPILVRLSALLGALRPGYRETEAVLRHPRGRIVWSRYRAESLATGRWDRLVCRFPELSSDPRLRRIVRWALERIHQDLVAAGGQDPVAMSLATIAVRLIGQLSDAPPLSPRRDELRSLTLTLHADRILRSGIEAIAWIVEERGLGGGRELDGLAWQLPLDRLWEFYVEAVIRKEASLVGGDVKVGRLGETVFPLQWTDPSHRSLGHLVPDIVVRRGRSLRVVDAKYKAHLAEIDVRGWHHFTDDAREAHRADIHQVLAYAALFDAEDVTATLVYPLRQATWNALQARRRDISRASLLHGGRRVAIELRGLPFGGVREACDA